MATTADAGSGTKVCIPDERSLPDGPFTALRYHFGMLLGVDDFETEQRYQRGKMRLHNAWLHRAGIVWGLDVDAVPDKREIRVEPGLALDPTGRELHLDVRCCMDIGAWYDEHAAEIADDVTVGEGTVTFDGHVVLLFCSCGTRPVPAISQPCEGAAVDTAYSRTFETVSICFLPKTSVPDPPPYPRLRVLFGLDDGARGELAADELAAIDADRAAVLASATPAETMLETFRRLADADTVALGPATLPDGTSTVFPALEDSGVVLADVNVTLAGSTGSWTLADGAAVIDRTPRRCHVATQTIEELLCGDLRGAAAAGPQVTSADVEGTTVTLGLDLPADAASVQPPAFSATQLEDDGWHAVAVDSAALSGDGQTITLTLGADPGATVFRLVAFGTGPTPIVGAAPTYVPLGGGRDYVHMTVPTS